MDDKSLHNEWTQNHIGKRDRKNKSIVIVFDESARKEFVTGFRKRKVQRRKIAEQQQEHKARLKRIQDRAEKRKIERSGYAAALDEDNDEGEEEEGDQSNAFGNEMHNSKRKKMKLESKKEEDEEEDEEEKDEEEENGGLKCLSKENVIVYKDSDSTTFVKTTVMDADDSEEKDEEREGEGEENEVKSGDEEETYSRKNQIKSTSGFNPGSNSKSNKKKLKKNKYPKTRTVKGRGSRNAKKGKRKSGK